MDKTEPSALNVAASLADSYSLAMSLKNPPQSPFAKGGQQKDSVINLRVHLGSIQK
jgi:hypothetical protein